MWVIGKLLRNGDDSSCSVTNISGPFVGLVRIYPPPVADTWLCRDASSTSFPKRPHHQSDIYWSQLSGRAISFLLWHLHYQHLPAAAYLDRQVEVMKPYKSLLLLLQDERSVGGRMVYAPLSGLRRVVKTPALALLCLTVSAPDAQFAPIDLSEILVPQRRQQMYYLQVNKKQSQKADNK